jgi:hypothetical protein
MSSCVVVKCSITRKIRLRFGVFYLMRNVVQRVVYNASLNSVCQSWTKV